MASSLPAPSTRVATHDTTDARPAATWRLVPTRGHVAREGATVVLAPRSLAVIEWGDVRVLLETRVESGRATLEKNSASERTLRIEGLRAGLDVTPLGADRTLTVLAYSTTVRVRGTRFSVDARSPSVVVAVDRGLVEVSEGAGQAFVPAGQAQRQRRILPIARSERAFLRLVPSPLLRQRARDSRGASLARARILVRQQAYDEALAEIGMIRRAQGDDSLVALDAELLEAQVRRAQGKPEQAVAIFERIGSRSDNRGERALFALGQCLASDLRDRAGALRAWQRYLARFQDGIFETEVKYQVGRTLIASGNTRSGVSQLRAFVNEHPASTHAARARELIARYGETP